MEQRVKDFAVCIHDFVNLRNVQLMSRELNKKVIEKSLVSLPFFFYFVSNQNDNMIGISKLYNNFITSITFFFFLINLCLTRLVLQFSKTLLQVRRGGGGGPGDSIVQVFWWYGKLVCPEDTYVDTKRKWKLHTEGVRELNSGPFFVKREYNYCAFTCKTKSLFVVTYYTMRQYLSVVMHRDYVMRLNSPFLSHRRCCCFYFHVAPHMIQWQPWLRAPPRETCCNWTYFDIIILHYRAGQKPLPPERKVNYLRVGCISNNSWSLFQKASEMRNV